MKIKHQRTLLDMTIGAYLNKNAETLKAIEEHLEKDKPNPDGFNPIPLDDRYKDDTGRDKPRP